MKSLYLIPLLAFSFVKAELFEAPTPEESAPSTNGWIGLSLGASSVAHSGAPTISARGGIVWGDWRLGIWATTIGSDVIHPDNGQEYLDYDAMGILVEPIVYRYQKASLSVPLLAGAGLLNYYIKGQEESKSAGAFFMGDAGLLGSYQITHHVRLAAGGGYRITYGIDKRNLSDSDFRTPYGEFQIVYGAF